MTFEEEKVATWLSFVLVPSPVPYSCLIHCPWCLKLPKSVKIPQGTSNVGYYQSSCVDLSCFFTSKFLVVQIACRYAMTVRVHGALWLLHLTWYFVSLSCCPVAVCCLLGDKGQGSSSPWTLVMQRSITTCHLLNPDFYAKSGNILSGHATHWSSRCLTIRHRMLWLLPSWEAEESCASPGLTFMRSLSADLDRGWGWPQSGHEFKVAS